MFLIEICANRSMAIGMIGVLLINVGSPDAPTPRAVRRYLAQFLADPRVIDLPWFWRRLLLHGWILRTRPRASAHAYRQIWLPEGSPLVVHSRAFAAALQQVLGSGYVVAPAMRNGAPSIAAGLRQLEQAGSDQLVVFPLYPHYAAATTGTGCAEVFRQLRRRWHLPVLRVIPPFYADPATLEAWAEVAGSRVRAASVDHLLVSFHGLPERHLAKPGADRLGFCYRAQCEITARSLACRLGLAEDRWSMAFQSRLGREPWIRPYTDATVAALARRGIRRLAVWCPSFVADCVETLEEIGIRARDGFLANGGAEFHLIPALNAHPAWVKAAARLVRNSEHTCDLSSDR